MLEQIASDQLFKRLDKLESGSLLLKTPDGKSRMFEGRKPGERAELELRSWKVVTNMLQRGDIAFAEDYRAGKWDTDNLVALTSLGIKNKMALDDMMAGHSLWRRVSMLSYFLKLNTLNGSKRNIHAHYDLGNDFYKLWLDPGMTYSSALYKHGGETLPEAQNNKYDRMIDALGKDKGSLLEVGCGWGGFAERAASRGDYQIKGITLSEQQYDYARARLGPKANIALEDYRHQNGKFDNIISIEMFEAVGERFWPTYFSKMGHLLKSNGRAVIQTITMNEKDFPRYRRGGDFVRSYIFPGGMLPSSSRFKEEADRAGLKTGNEFYFGQDYARTLEKWLNDFDKKREEVKALGFDDGFIRLWRFYLAACAAGFKTGKTNVMQIELGHG